MPYFNYWRRPYRRRYYPRRRPRKTFRRRRFRRRVRPFFYKRKLQRLTLREWQPPVVHKLKVRGLINLLTYNHNRLPFNDAMYESSWVPAHLSNGGGFSVVQFTLENLYTQHEHLRNYWTKTNMNLPLFRYTYCRLKLYQSKYVDYLLKPQNHYPMTSQQLTYTATQPSLMIMQKGVIKMPSKTTKPKRKPFRIIKLHPPSLFKNKWYFQQDQAKTPLLLLHTAATSFDNWYISKNAENNNISIHTLNTKLFKNIFWNKDYTTSHGYPIDTQGTINKYLWTTHSNKPFNELQLKDLIFLGETKIYKAGQSCADTPGAVNWNTYKNTTIYWGNPFHEAYLMGNDPIFQSTSDKLSWQIIQTKSTGDDKIENLVTKVDTPLQFPVRYNPNKDDGTHNRCYLLSVSKPKIGYDPPTDLNLQLDGFPLWTTIWGFTDYIKKLQITQQTDISYILVVQNGTTNPNWETIVPLDWDFCNGRSPLQGGENPDIWDQNKWYPQLQYQNQAMNDIAFCGPGAPKYTDIKSDEIKLEYEFHFKLGGNPLPMAEVHNPLLQGTFPTPSNIKQTTSLQNPTTPIETYLQGFDQRRGFLTKAAIERISKDWGLKKPSFKTSTGLSMDVPVHQTLQTSEDEASTEEEKEETLFTKLIKQRQKQQRLKQRILLTLQQIQNIE
nr:MAG: ORF1 [TTV-like mini virus]